MMWMVDGVLAARHPHEVYGLIRDESGESRVGGSDVRSSGDIPCPRRDSGRYRLEREVVVVYEVHQR